MNGTDLIQQFSCILYMILFGITAMFGFAFINEIGKQIKWHRNQRMIADFILVVFCGIGFCVVLICKNYGLLRNYVLLGLAIGFAVYGILLRRLCNKICQHTARWVLWWCKKTKWIIGAPYRLIKRQLIQRIKRKMLAIHQRYTENGQNDDDLEEII